MSNVGSFFHNVKRNILSIMFWAPLANWGFVIAGCNDLKKEPVYISEKMTTVLTIYSLLFMRYALAIKPKNYLLFSCHATNTLVQSILLYKKLKYETEHPKIKIKAK
ncbi:mitochondrial pyruvate carrier protein 1, putative [Plasmodium reichenowi]|uniref:Mitochondrial pyruvate carrier n=1 Tax=Plasmodium reichenowi TaxID=5854 RepID=A0A151L788_PLARE|nr:mitochondrial pyruvate carrier protein 1, putative [Plasmodium reichenowi]KYN94834.1 mitochondrial pyruvate carrier protein 1, putative [Plasmodium reichenowi]SOV82039.1 mitochondrial pyruvate carrier protein 1, putative [Plasmodium reichenowi]